MSKTGQFQPSSKFKGINNFASFVTHCSGNVTLGCRIYHVMVYPPHEDNVKFVLYLTSQLNSYCIVPTLRQCCRYTYTYTYY